MTQPFSAHRVFAIAVILITLTIGCRVREEPQAPDGLGHERLNVVLITVDTLRADAVGAYREGLETSPNIDLLAREGVLFERCSTASPNTIPSHATILTGRYPYAHGVRSNAGYLLASENRTLAEVFREEGYVTAAETAGLVLKRRMGLDQGFNQYRDVDSVDVVLKKVRVSGGELTFAKKTLQERPASDITEKGIEFLASHREQPFFLWLHYYDPHWAYAAPPEFAEKFPDNAYYGEVAYTDRAIGQFMSALQRLGLGNQTLVVLTSDHGEGLGEHGEKSHSYLVYETTIHVPLVVWGAPGFTAGKRVAAPVRTLDIASTVLDLAGLAPLFESQGVSLRGHMGDEDDGPEDLIAYGESIEAYASFGAPVLRYIRQGPWKYIHTARPELYDVDQDPGELSNRASDQPQRVTALREELETLLTQASPALADSTVEMDPEGLEQLRQLGYHSDPSATPIEDELATLDVSGMDVKDLLADVQELSAVYALLNTAGRAGDARPEELEGIVLRFEKLARRHPNGLSVVRGWTRALDELQRTEETVPLLARAVELAPRDNRIRLQYVRALQQTGDLSEAVTQAGLAIEQNACGAQEIAYLSGAMRAQQHYEEQRDFLAERMLYCDSDGVRNEYAYFLATCSDDRYRDGGLALELATLITSTPGGMRLEYVDTLAAAQAEVGDMAAAVVTQRQAVAALEERGADSIVLTTFREHLRAYQAGKPLREP